MKEREEIIIEKYKNAINEIELSHEDKKILLENLSLRKEQEGKAPEKSLKRKSVYVYAGGMAAALLVLFIAGKVFLPAIKGTNYNLPEEGVIYYPENFPEESDFVENDFSEAESNMMESNKGTSFENNETFRNDAIANENSSFMQEEEFQIVVYADDIQVAEKDTQEEKKTTEGKEFPKGEGDSAGEESDGSSAKEILLEKDVLYQTFSEEIPYCRFSIGDKKKGSYRVRTIGCYLSESPLGKKNEKGDEGKKSYDSIVQAGEKLYLCLESEEEGGEAHLFGDNVKWSDSSIQTVARVVVEANGSQNIYIGRKGKKYYGMIR